MWGERFAGCRGNMYSWVTRQVLKRGVEKELWDLYCAYEKGFVARYHENWPKGLLHLKMANDFGIVVEMRWV